MKRIWCYLFHWRDQRRQVSRNAYGWNCGICNTQWRVRR